jgi:hypothetical protein
MVNIINRNLTLIVTSPAGCPYQPPKPPEANNISKIILLVLVILVFLAFLLPLPIQLCRGKRGLELFPAAIFVVFCFENVIVCYFFFVYKKNIFRLV